MAETEKITLNVSVVDLGKIDLLVAEGFYANRTDFIRTALRRQLDMHADEVQRAVVRNEYLVGIVAHSRDGLEKHLKKGEKIAIRAVGMVVITGDVSPELAAQTIDSISVLGVLKASDEVKSALAGRIH